MGTSGMKAKNRKTRNAVRGFSRVLGTFALLYLAGCGGGGSSGIRDSEPDALRSDSRVVRLDEIVERADTMFLPSVYINYRLTASGETVRDSLALNLRCSGTRCTGPAGFDTELDELLVPTEDTYVEEAILGSRGGFDTVTARSGFEVGNNISGVTFLEIPSAMEYGLWGQYGYAAAGVLDGPISGRVDGIAFKGSIEFTVAYAAGDATGTNPAGIGGASWRGVAEAVSTRSFERRQGTAVMTIEDLSQPRVSVGVDIEGYPIGSPAWSNMVLAAGRYRTGVRGQDYLEGGLFGPGHEETYGVFDTGAYLGAFGAKRE